MLLNDVLAAYRYSPGVRLTAAALRRIVWDLMGTRTKFMRSSLKRQG